MEQLDFEGRARMLRHSLFSSVFVKLVAYGETATPEGGNYVMLLSGLPPVRSAMRATEALVGPSGPGAPKPLDHYVEKNAAATDNGGVRYHFVPSHDENDPGFTVELPPDYPDEGQMLVDGSPAKRVTPVHPEAYREWVTGVRPTVTTVKLRDSARVEAIPCIGTNETGEPYL
jgi:hypothetical protein